MNLIYIPVWSPYKFCLNIANIDEPTIDLLVDIGYPLKHIFEIINYDRLVKDTIFKG